jgi:hypothetical protein
MKELKRRQRDFLRLNRNLDLDELKRDILEKRNAGLDDSLSSHPSSGTAITKKKK